MPRLDALIAAVLMPVFLIVAASPTLAQSALPDDDVLIRAMVDELNRSMRDLVLQDLPRPYFIQYRAQDQIFFSMSAAWGGLLKSDHRRSRSFRSRIRVGSYELDNTNVGGGGVGAALPLDDDYPALRHAIWRVSDLDYKQAVEVLTRKKAYLVDKNIDDRPDDLSPADPVHRIEPSAEIALDHRAWEANLTRLSARFKKHPHIQYSHVTLFAGAVNDFIVNSEGTRLRTADTGVLLRIEARLQAEEGMWLQDVLSYIAEQPDQLPPLDQITTDVDELCASLIELADAPIVEHYLGPVLFEPEAAGKAFAALLANGLCARPLPLGASGLRGDSLEKLLGRRILPRSFRVYDDPGPKWFEGTLLAGAYVYDDEAVPAARVTLVEKGILKNLLAGRAPTKKVTRSTGHGRSAGLGDARSTIGCLYACDDAAMSDEELKEELIQAARDEGIDFALRVASTSEGRPGTLGRPIRAYRVYVEDGREEPVRGLEFLPVPTRALKRLLAAGSSRQVYNAISGIPASIVSPAVIFEELELTRFEEESDKLPILKSPATRGR